MWEFRYGSYTVANECDWWSDAHLMGEMLEQVQ
jgi:hypothetical protein